MQYVAHFEKRYMRYTMGSGAKTPEAGGIFENFCVKSNLCRVTFNCDRKNWISRMYYLLPNNFVGAQVLPLLPLPIFPRPMNYHS